MTPIERRDALLRDMARSFGSESAVCVFSTPSGPYAMWLGCDERRARELFAAGMSGVEQHMVVHEAAGGVA